MVTVPKKWIWKCTFEVEIHHQHLWDQTHEDFIWFCLASPFFRSRGRAMALCFLETVPCKPLLFLFNKKMDFHKLPLRRRSPEAPPAWLLGPKEPKSHRLKEGPPLDCCQASEAGNVSPECLGECPQAHLTTLWRGKPRV